VFERASRNLHALMRGVGLESHVPGAPFHLLSIRAPRQAALRTSFGLAPSSYRATLRSTDREDARCDEPMSAIQSNHVHPHLARSRLRAPLARRGHPAESLAPRSETGGPGVFTTPETASAGRRTTHVLCTFRVSASMHQRGRFLPTEPCATEPLTPLSRSFCRLPPLSSSRELRLGRVSLHSTRIGAGRKTEEPPRPPSFAPREKERSRNDPGCLPSSGTLRRIRWPLQPRSRDDLTAFGDGAAAE
jgi:hypothetical protein